jgi:hypothetical protein
MRLLRLHRIGYIPEPVRPSSGSDPQRTTVGRETTLHDSVCSGCVEASIQSAVQSSTVRITNTRRLHHHDDQVPSRCCLLL